VEFRFKKRHKSRRGKGREPVGGEKRVGNGEWI
jgi:hypothetical protein